MPPGTIQIQDSESKAGVAVRYLSVRAYAELLGVATSTVYKALEEGRLPHVRVRNAIRIAVGR
jgi:excisionase family DNA binding protein